MRKVKGVLHFWGRRDYFNGFSSSKSGHFFALANDYRYLVLKQRCNETKQVYEAELNHPDEVEKVGEERLLELFEAQTPLKQYKKDVCARTQSRIKESRSNLEKLRLENELKYKIERQKTLGKTKKTTTQKVLVICENKICEGAKS